MRAGRMYSSVCGLPKKSKLWSPVTVLIFLIFTWRDEETEMNG
jgi:hypothetical protein